MIKYLSVFLVWCCLCLSAFGAVVRWTGAAQDVRQSSTISVTGTWATGDTATLTINFKNLTVTIGAATSTADVASAIAAAVDAADATTGLVGTESRNFGGEEIPEFAEINADANGAVLTLSSDVPGVPFTLTRSETTAGDGALGAVTAVTAATGKNWLSNAANYNTGTVPVDGDTLTFDSGDVDVLYALDHFLTNNIDLTWIITNDWTGQFGLPPVNATGGYVEYRRRYVSMRGGNAGISVLPGSLGNTTCGRLYMDATDQAGQSFYFLADRNAASGVPTVYLSGADATTPHAQIVIKAGNIVIEDSSAPAAGTAKSFEVLEWEVGEYGNAVSNVMVTIGNTVRMVPADDVPFVQRSGTVYCDATDLFDGGTNDVDLLIAGGVFEFGGASLGHCRVDRQGGVVFNTENLLTLYGDLDVYGGGVDLTKCRELALDTGVNVNLYANSSLLYPVYNGLTAVRFRGCRISDCPATILPPSREFDLTNAAP